MNIELIQKLSLMSGLELTENEEMELLYEIEKFSERLLSSSFFELESMPYSHDLVPALLREDLIVDSHKGLGLLKKEKLNSEGYLIVKSAEPSS